MAATTFKLRLGRACSEKGCRFNGGAYAYRGTCFTQGHAWKERGLAWILEVTAVVATSPTGSRERWTDVCQRCGLHESLHRGGRCLLSVGRISLPEGTS
jgi:hypothetical protein